MDPDATLAELRELLVQPDPGADADDRLAAMAELVQAMDAWLSAGGFLPAAWCPVPPAPRA